MKKHLALTSMAVLAVALLATPAFSQTMAVRADIPFAFSANGTEMPAGPYRLAQDGVVINWRTSGKGFLTLAGNRTEDNQQYRTCLVFRVYGDQYILSEIWAGNVGREFPISKVEQKLARHRLRHADDDRKVQVIE